MREQQIAHGGDVAVAGKRNDCAERAEIAWLWDEVYDCASVEENT